MKLFEAFEELNTIEEAVTHSFFGDYTSPYLNLSETERQEAEHTWIGNISVQQCLMANGELRTASSHERWNNQGFFILDMDVYHRAYDKDLEANNLFRAFNKDGTIGPSRCYSYYKELSEQGKAKEPGAQAFISLWEKLYGQKLGWWRNLMVTKTALDDKITQLKARAAAKAKQEEEERIRREEAAKKAEEERLERERIKQEQTELADKNFDIIEDLVQQAIQKIDPKLLELFEEYSESEPIEVENHGTYNKINIPGIGSLDITNKKVPNLTVQELQDSIEWALEEADLQQKLIDRDSGMEVLKILQENNRGTRTVFGYFYSPSESAYYRIYPRKTTPELMAETSGGQINYTQQQAPADITLVGAVVLYSDPSNSNRTTADKHFYRYYSFNSDHLENTVLSNIVPEDSNFAMCPIETDWYETPPNGESFITEPPFDCWAFVKITETATD